MNVDPNYGFIILNVIDTCRILGTINAKGINQNFNGSGGGSGGSGGGGHVAMPITGGNGGSSGVFLSSATPGGLGVLNSSSNGVTPSLDDQYAALTPFYSLTGGKGGGVGSYGSCGGTSAIEGNGGGGVIIYCKYLIYTGTIDTRGNNGQIGTSNCRSDAGGGGGGGIFIKSPNVLVNSGSSLYTGGSGSFYFLGAGTGGNGWFILVNQ